MIRISNAGNRNNITFCFLDPKAETFNKNFKNYLLFPKKCYNKGT